MLLVAGVAGTIALSYEILWVRAYSFVTGGTASSFGVLLGAYLFGLAIGSLLSWFYCNEGRALAGRERLATPAVLLVAASALGFLSVPALAALAVRGRIARCLARARRRLRRSHRSGPAPGQPLRRHGGRPGRRLALVPLCRQHSRVGGGLFADGIRSPRRSPDAPGRDRPRACRPGRRGAAAPGSRWVPPGACTSPRPARACRRADASGRRGPLPPRLREDAVEGKVRPVGVVHRSRRKSQRRHHRPERRDRFSAAASTTAPTAWTWFTTRT